MTSLEKIFIFVMTAIVLGMTLICQEKKIGELETKVSLLSQHIDRNSKVQLLLNDAYQIATSNELRISDHLVEIADMMKNHMADTSIHQKVITLSWNGTNSWLITTNYVTLPYVGL